MSYIFHFTCGQCGIVSKYSFFETDDDENDMIDRPTIIDHFSNHEIIKIRSGNYQCLALDKSGIIWSWGAGLLGNGEEIYDSNPQKIEYIGTASDIDMFGDYSAALINSEIRIWGYLFDSNENPVKSYEPISIDELNGKQVLRIFCLFDGIACIIKEDSKFSLKVFSQKKSKSKKQEFPLNRSDIPILETYHFPSTLKFEVPFPFSIKKILNDQSLLIQYDDGSVHRFFKNGDVVSIKGAVSLTVGLDNRIRILKHESLLETYDNNFKLESSVDLELKHKSIRHGWDHSLLF